MQYSNGGGCRSALPAPMKLISWNCRGLGNLCVVRALKELICFQVPDVVFLMESRRKDYEMNRLRGMGGLSNVIYVSCVGTRNSRSGGLTCMWREGVEIDLASFSLNHMDLIIKIEESGRVWRASGIYGFPKSKKKTPYLFSFK